MIKAIKRILLIIFTLFVIAFFLLAYSLTVTLIKPRDITKAFNQVNNYFISSEEVNFASKKVILLWNKNKYSFQLEFLNNKFAYLDEVISIPNLRVDFDIIDLLKFKFSKIYINYISYKINNNAINQSSSINIIDFLYGDQSNKLAWQNDFANKLNNLDKIINKLNNVQIKQIDLIAIDNQKKYQIKNLTIKNYNLDKNLKISWSFLAKDKLKFNSKINCIKNKQNLLDNCIFNFKDLHAKSEDNYLHSDLSLKLVRQADNNYNFSTQAKIKHIIYKDASYYNLDFNIKANIIEYFIDKINLDLNYFNKKISLLANLTKNKQISLNISGNNLDKQEVFLLWQEKFAHNARKWLQKSLSKADLKNFFLNLEFDLNQDKILTKLAGEFHVANSDLKFHDKYGVVTNIEALVKLQKYRLDIAVKQAFIEEEKISNLHVFIPYMVKGKSILNIKAQTALPANKIIDFLLAYRVKQEKLTKLKQIFLDNKLLFDLDLAIKLNKKITSDHIQLAVNGLLQNLSTKLFDESSYAKLSLNKKFTDAEYFTNLDYKHAGIKFPIIQYNKKIGGNFKVNFATLVKQNKLLFQNIKLIADNANLNNANFTLQDGAISKLNFPNIKFDKNQLSLKFVKNKFIINAQEIFLNKLGFSNNSSNGFSLNSNFLLKIDKLFFISNHQLKNLHLMANCLPKCRFVTFEADIENNNKNKRPQKIFAQYNNDKNKELIFETNNAGYVLNILHSDNKLVSGALRLNLSKTAQEKIIGDVNIENFAVINTSIFSKLLKFKLFRRGKVTKQKLFKFDKAKANFSMDNQILNLKKMTSYGAVFGITSQGEINFLNKKINLQGVIVPAYHVNNLLGIKNIPILGKIITGSDNKGLVSATYNVKGSLDNNKISVNPLTIIMPSFIKDIKELF